MADPLFYVTTPIYYVNSAPHLGHAYTTLLADTAARFWRLWGKDVYFLTGTDEHGEKISRAAAEEGIGPQEYVDRMSALFREEWPRLGVEPTKFIRTTDPSHRAVVQKILLGVKEAGDIYFAEYEGKYCTGCERFYTEKELVGGVCPDHKTAPEAIREKNYFFRMSKYQQWLIDYLGEHPDFIRPAHYRNEVLAFLRDPLEDLCISRPKNRLRWGIPLPFDENYVTYVWFDALINYVSAPGYPDGRDFEKYWPSVEHLIAKDILKPHGIYWPTMLRSAGIKPYRHLNVHGYWTIDNEKMSKSRGQVVRPLDLVDKYGLDAFRYFVLREMAFGHDSTFSEEALVNRLNADLANDLGNLVGRTISMVQRYFKGRVPEKAEIRDEDRVLLRAIDSALEAAPRAVESFTFHRALTSIWEVIATLNKYIDRSAPWSLAKAGETERLGTVLYCCAESIRVIALLVSPFMPETAEKIFCRLGIPEPISRLRLPEAGRFGALAPGLQTHKAGPLFPRVDAAEALKDGSTSTNNE